MPPQNDPRYEKVGQGSGNVESETNEGKIALEKSRRKIQSEMDREPDQEKQFFLFGQSDHKTESKNDESLLGYKGNLTFVLILGLTLSTINDFVDLIFWQRMDLLAPALDITLLFMFFLLLALLGRSLMLAVGLIFFTFILEIVPILGVIPFWTICIIAWYVLSRRK